MRRFGKILAPITIISILLISSVPNVLSDIEKAVSSYDGELIDNIKIRSRGPYLLEIILREHAFAVLFNNNNDQAIYVSFYINVTDGGGHELFNSREVSPPFKIKSNSLNQWQCLCFKDFRNKGHFFGFFDVIVDFTVLDDGSSRKEVFHGFIFGISTLFFNPNNGEVID